MKPRSSLWPPLITAFLGAWMIIAPSILRYEETEAAMIDRILGPALIVISTIGLWEFMSGLRWLSLLLGFALLGAPLIYDEPIPPALGNSVIVGLMVLGLSLLDRSPHGNYGGGWSALWRKDTEWMRIKLD